MASVTMTARSISRSRRTGETGESQASLRLCDSPGIDLGPCFRARSIAGPAFHGTGSRRLAPSTRHLPLPGGVPDRRQELLAGVHPPQMCGAQDGL